jgi:hypothetical protein
MVRRSKQKQKAAIRRPSFAFNICWWIFAFAGGYLLQRGDQENGDAFQQPPSAGP